jgi:acyl-coenzyme A synthetase/AMP-(fatty) acid ligase
MVIGNLLSRLGPKRWFALARRIRSGAEFLVSGERRLTRREVFANVEALAAGLQALGLGPGDRLATLLPAGPEAVYALFLPWLLGTWEVPLNPLLREHELRHILADCGTRAVLTTRRWYGHNHPATLARLMPDLPDLQAVIVQGAEGGDDTVNDHGSEFFALDEVLAPGRPLSPVRVAASEIGRITYTSGTTGLPKGAVHTWVRYWNLAHPRALLRLDPLLFRCVLFPFPLCYYHGALAVVTTLLAGGRLLLVDRFNPRQMLETIERERVTLLAASPTMARLLLRVPGQERRDLSSVRRIFVGTEVCPPDLAQALHERFRCPLENMYATNETGNITWTGRRDSWQRVTMTVGKPAPGVRLRIVDDERQPLPIGAVGEIAVRTSQMMSGYHGDPALTARALDAEGWFFTGDLGTLGDDGYLRLTGRKKDVIVRGGFKIYPEEVEHYLEQHPLVRRAGVVGRSGGDGEVVWAFLELAPGAALTAAQVRKFCLGQIAPFKIPEQVCFVERLPTTVTDKVQRFKLREIAADKGQV